jgi:hypothetical protein
MSSLNTFNIGAFFDFCPLCVLCDLCGEKVLIRHFFTTEITENTEREKDPRVNIEPKCCEWLFCLKMSSLNTFNIGAFFDFCPLSDPCGKKNEGFNIGLSRERGHAEELFVRLFCGPWRPG